MTPPPISPVPATEPRRDECSCAAWRVNVPRLNAPFILAAGRNPGTYKGYDGDPLRYCPWCGTWLGSPPAVVESSEGLREAMEAWREFAQHQTWCAQCADSVDDCPLGEPLRIAAHAADAALSPHRP